MNFSVIGLGYVGLASAVLLARKHSVVAIDISDERVEMIKNGISPISDFEIQEHLSSGSLNLSITNCAEIAYENPDYIIVATPTNYDPVTNYFDTSSVESVIAAAINRTPETTIIIKSTVPVGFTERMRSFYKTEKIIFSPEFLREGRALHDNLYPSRIIMGDTSEEAKIFSEALSSCSLMPDVPVIFCNSSEAEAIKLFSNSYLAMRVAFFNELDSYALIRNLDSKMIISGVSLDNRIGDNYNNPSFGYGGYCLPKDTKQLLANYSAVPQNIISAIVDANQTRKEFLANYICELKPSIVGVHRLVMKQGSDNFRDSSIFRVVEIMRDKGISVIIYEPEWKGEDVFGCKFESDISEFKIQCELIIANRWSEDLYDVADKVFTRDVFKKD